MSITHWQRLIQTILRTQSRHCPRRNLRIQSHRRKKIARRQLQDYERENRHSQQKERGVEKASCAVFHLKQIAPEESIPPTAPWKEVPWCKNARETQITRAFSSAPQFCPDTSPQLRRQIARPNADRARYANSRARARLAGPRAA